jgi:hypothetical protein
MAKPRVKHVHAAIEASVRTLKQLGPDVEELLRRREHDAADGYPSSSMGGGGNSGTVSDPTQRAALTKPPQDSIATAIDSIFAKLTEVDNLCRSIGEKHRLVFDVEQNERGRQSSGKHCRACGEFISGVGDDRSIRGYDRKHYDRFRTWAIKENEAGREASDIVFCDMIKRELAEEAKGKKLVKV